MTVLLGRDQIVITGGLGTVASIAALVLALVIGCTIAVRALQTSKRRRFGMRRVTVGVNLPVLGIQGEWTPTDAEREAAWELYIEIVTRTTVVDLSDAEGLLCEALESLHSLFDTTRGILRKHGPSVATPATSGQQSFGSIAIALLNNVLRPVLAKWHPALEEYESRRPSGVSVLEHERHWDEAGSLRSALRSVRLVVNEYARILEDVAGIPSIVHRDSDTTHRGVPSVKLPFMRQ